MATTCPTCPQSVYHSPTIQYAEQNQFDNDVDDDDDDDDGDDETSSGTDGTDDGDNSGLLRTVMIMAMIALIRQTKTAALVVVVVVAEWGVGAGVEADDGQKYENLVNGPTRPNVHVLQCHSCCRRRQRRYGFACW